MTDTLQTAVADNDTRTLSFLHLHTKETITVTFKRNGRFDDAALKKLNWFMRDWRKNEDVTMDPQLFDLLWEVYREVGGKEPIEIICGYRSPGTNAMLRARSSGVAQVSQHTSGNAIDFHIPGADLEKVRNAGLRLQRGGVGFYPSSGSPFVHMDTGSVRHWPRMTHDQLARVFPDGRTVHVPSDGQPLPGYELALADIERAGRSASTVGLMARSTRPDADDETTASTSPTKGSVLARMFGFGKKDEDAETPRGRTAVAQAAAPKPVTTQRIVPLPQARPAIPEMQVAAATEAVPLPRMRPDIKPVVLAAATPPAETRVPLRSAIQSSPLPPIEEPMTTASLAADDDQIAQAMAYAPVEKEAPVVRATPAAPMGKRVKQAAAAPVTPLPPLSGGFAVTGPWARAVMLTPNVAMMKTVAVGIPDPRPIAKLYAKPESALPMTFAMDPNPGLYADRFTGSAVVTLTATSFSRTASLP